LFGIKWAQVYSNSFRFNIVIVQCLGVYFFTGHNVDKLTAYMLLFQCKSCNVLYRIIIIIIITRIAVRTCVV